MELTELCKLGEKYGTDKCPQINHNYTPFYYKLFNPIKNDVKKVLELGVGVNKPSRRVVSGASLRMWRDFFPNAQIYGTDNRLNVHFEEDRIKTFLADGVLEKDWDKVLAETGTDIDIFIDDGSHLLGDQIATAEILLPKLKKDVVYIIEDVVFPEQLEIDYDYDIIKFIIRDRFSRRRDDNNLVIIKNK